MPPPPLSNIAPARVRESTEIDPRVERSTHALGRALVELIQEREFDDITVQHILDRAGVGRATFYAHYRNKEDALHSSYERLFGALEPMLARPSAVGPRLFPVAELLEHMADSRGLVDALRRDGRLDEVWRLLAGHAARLVERRLALWAADFDAVTSPIPRPLAARMLAGALIEAIGWWEARPLAATPAEMDAAFHELARGMLRRTR